jgi:anaerobic magnesium-protoporphyrin IX monomethyl ester cyclase
MGTQRPFRTFLIFPPVWTPVTPYLALPALVAYLRREGLDAAQYDASLDFFDRCLLTPGALSELADRVRRRATEGGYRSLTKRKTALLEGLQGGRSREWDEKIVNVRGMVETLRHKERFYDAGSCLQAQQCLYDLLELVSLAYHPTALTFNTFSSPALSGFQEMAAFCEDPEANPFFRFAATRLPEIMQREAPSLVGISISTSHQLAGALTMGRWLRRNCPSVHVTLGGKHCLRLRDSIHDDASLFTRFCNSMVLDNGERPLTQLIRQLAGGGTLDKVPGLLHVRAGRLVQNLHEAHEPIDALPVPDFSDLPLDAYYAPEPILPMRLSEGCYWGKCTFCSRYDDRRFQTLDPETAVARMKFQTLDPETAVARMKWLRERYHASCFTVNDDCLTPTYLEEWSRRIVEEGAGFKISLWCKPVHSFTRERLALLSKAGVRLIRWGVETGHPRILKLMNKGTRLATTVRVLKDASEEGIWNHATVIFGFPSETESEARTTVRFLEEHRDIIHSSIFFRFVLLKHSFISRHPEAFGIQSVRQPEGPFSYEHPFVTAEGMGEKDLARFLSWAQRHRIERVYDQPFWFPLRIREYLLLYVARYGLRAVHSWKARPGGRQTVSSAHDLEYAFSNPVDIPEETMEKIRGLVISGGEVGRSWLTRNLENAHLVGYAHENGDLVGVMTHKVPLPEYVRRIGEKTGLDLTGYLERGYTYVLPEYRGLRVGDRLLKGLVERSPGKKIYVTIRMDNEPAIRLTRRNHMRLAATYHNERTGHDIGVFVSG